MGKPNPSDNPWRAVAMISAAGAELVVSMAIGYFAGRWIGGLFGGHPIWTVIGILAGFALGVAGIVMVIRSITGDRHG
jgi:Putative F0F1-ATPase subunit (ATPase_gene1).